MRKRVIGIFTGNRAEYGLQYPILRAINDHPELDYRLIVSGAHLDKNFGKTLKEIKQDGFRIDAEVKIEMDANSLFSTAQAIGFGIIEISRALRKLKPDLFVVYADRFEGLAAVIAASQMNIPTAHIEGGDLTEGGALDDSVRHAMTKLSHLHFTTNQQATNRILAMGEEAWRIHTVGFPAIDLISQGRYAKSEEIVQQLKLDLSRPIVIFTQHSVTTEFEKVAFQIKPSLLALQEASKMGIQVIITYPNNDAGGKEIIKHIEVFRKLNLLNIQVHSSLGIFLYHGILALTKNIAIRVACVGNSSSGIKETPAFGCPTVNIGSRQSGRLRGKNVIDTDYNSNEIISAIQKCLFDDVFRKSCILADNPYWLGDAGPKVAKILAEIPLSQKLIQKKMTLKGEIKNGWYR